MAQVVINNATVTKEETIKIASIKLQEQLTFILDDKQRELISRLLVIVPMTKEEYNIFVEFNSIRDKYNYVMKYINSIAKEVCPVQMISLFSTITNIYKDNGNRIKKLQKSKVNFDSKEEYMALPTRLCHSTNEILEYTLENIKYSNESAEVYFV